MDTLLDNLRRLLTKAAALLPSIGDGKGRFRLPPPRVVDKLGQELMFLRQPGSVVNVLLFRDSEQVYQKLYDPVAGRIFSNLEFNVGQVAAVRGLLDFMRDSFPGGGNCVGYGIDDWLIVGLVEGKHTLVAMTRATSDYEVIEKWLRDLALKLVA